MDNETAKKLWEIRTSLGSLKNFGETNEFETEIDDPISAYFKQRCKDSSTNYFKKRFDSDSDSSVGLIDVDNVSLFGDGGENDINTLRLSDNIIEKLRDSLNAKNEKIPYVEKSSADFQLDKQRALAQKALKKINVRSNKSENEEIVKSPETTRESKVLSDISSKLFNAKLSLEKDVDSWFQPNCSPNTPRFFNDELSSYFDNGDIPVKDENFTKRRESHYAKKVSSILKECSQANINPEAEFESQTKEEQIHRFEEDEKKFKLENSGLLHNSEISQFSGPGGEISQWLLNSSSLKAEGETNKLSIGQFFNMRSNRVSSLLGSKDDGKQPQKSESSETNDPKSPKSECSFTTNHSLLPKKFKPRLYGSSCELSRNTESRKSTRYSSDSCSSQSTLMIQNILSEMESGLSGTEIYEKLLKSYANNLNEDKSKQKIKKTLNLISENSETPKSSKVSRRKEAVKDLKKPEKEPIKESRNRILAKEFKENEPVRDSELNESFPCGRTKGRLNSGRSFDASTPKLRFLKNQNDRLKSSCSKIIMDAEDWEAPRVSSIHPMIDLNKSEVSDENDKTILINSTTTSSEHKKHNTTATNDTVTIEDTIVAGDLTVLSQRIEELNKDDLSRGKNSKDDEQTLLTVIQKLAELPKGSVDCSALTPLLREQFPDLLSTFLTNPKLSSMDTLTPTNDKAQEALLFLPGSWIELPGVIGVKEKIFACADLEKTVFVHFANITQKWLLISVEHIELSSGHGQKLAGVKKNNEWTVMDFVDFAMKDTVVPPNSRQSLKISLTSRIATKFELIIRFTIKEMISKEFQTRNLRVLVNSVHPENYINVIPKDSINFGVIADQCFDQRTVQVTFDGICELPLTVYVEEGEAISQHFILKPYNAISGSLDGECNDNIFYHVFREGEKQVLEFRVIFQPNVLLQEDDKTHSFKALLVLMLGSKTETDGILRKIPIKGSVGFAKFLCNPSCNPLVFRASDKGQSVSRSYPLKNVGSLPIAFSVKVVNNESKTEEVNDLFAAPNSFYLSRNEEAEIKITFNAKTSENCTKRRLYLRIKPNGRALYDVELIGLIASSDREPLRRTSSASSSTKSIANSDAVPVKLLTTCNALSWPAVGLEKEMRQTFQIKIKANAPASVRISFRKNSDSFKLVNEYGEKVSKLRKIFKPDVPQTLTVTFRPDLVGSHLDCLVLETSHSDKKKMISLSGVGGMPNLFLGNVKSDLNGCKLLRLQNSSKNNEYINTLDFKNEGKIPGFVLIRPNSEVFCLSSEMKISPSSFVVAPNSTVAVKVSQRLKNDDLRLLLSDKDICKLATMSVVTGDEPSRLRLRKLIKNGKIKMSDRLETLAAVYHNEQTMNVNSFEDSWAFENQFLKSLNQVEVAVVLERSAGVCDPTILEEDSGDEFATIISVHDTTVIPSPKLLQSNEAYSSHSESPDNNPFEALIKTSSDEKITKWFETLECN